MHQGRDLLRALQVSISSRKYVFQVQLVAPKLKMGWHPPPLAPCPIALLYEQLRLGTQQLGKGTPFTLLSLSGHVLGAHLTSLQGGPKVLLGHLFLCHQEAPGHLGVPVDQGGQWLHLDLGHPRRSSHRHDEMEQQWPYGARDTCTASLGHQHRCPKAI